MDELNRRFRRFLTAVGLGVLGLVATPVGILLWGSVLFFWRRFPDVAQGFYSTLTIFGILAAPLGGIYWFAAGAWLGGLVGHRPENRGAPWRVVFTVYAVCLVAIATLIGLTQR